MPTQKDLKRLVRARMEKTGESYTAARMRLLERRPPAKTGTKPASATLSKDFAARAGMSDAVLAKKTGRTWAEWVTELDRAGAAARTHREIARLLADRFDTPPWWTQTIAVGYERIRGLREKGQQRDGSYSVNKSKVYPVPLAELWTAFGRCERWLGGAKLRMGKATKPKSMHMRWEDGTPIDVGFFAKGPSKSQVQLAHSRLASRAEAERQRKFWTERLAKLGDVLAE